MFCAKCLEKVFIVLLQGINECPVARNRPCLLSLQIRRALYINQVNCSLHSTQLVRTTTANVAPSWSERQRPTLHPAGQNDNGQRCANLKAAELMHPQQKINFTLPPQKKKEFHSYSVTFWVQTLSQRGCSATCRFWLFNEISSSSLFCIRKYTSYTHKVHKCH